MGAPCASTAANTTAPDGCAREASAPGARRLLFTKSREHTMNRALSSMAVRRLVLTFVGVASVCVTAVGQSKAAADTNNLKFEVISVKPFEYKPDANGDLGVTIDQSGRFRANGLTLRDLI